MMKLMSPEVRIKPAPPLRAWNRHLQNSLRRFSTSVSVVTVESERGPIGSIVNSFTSVSTDPPLVLVAVRKSAIIHESMLDRPFAINVLGAEDRGLAAQLSGMAGTDPAWVEGEYAPRLGNALAHFECTKWAHYDLGDRTLCVGLVEDFDYHRGDALAMDGDEFVAVPEYLLGFAEVD